jgi:sugar (pentulose or hexulose) kinase
MKCRMAESLALCADVGTSSLKAAFIDCAGAARKTGRLAAFVRVPYDRAVNDITSSTWESALRRAIISLYKIAPNAKIEAVCISGNGPTLVPVTKTGERLMPLHWFNTATPDIPLRSFFLPRVYYFREKHPQCFKKTACFFSCHEWLLFRLGGQAVTALPNYEYVPYYWDKEQCGRIGLDMALFPPFTGMGSITGYVSAKASALFALAEGIPLVAGGPDFIMAMLGTGTITSGLVCDRAGSSEGINVCITGEKYSELKKNNASMRLLPHAISGYWNAGIVIPESGSVFERWRKEQGMTRRSYDEILESLLPAPGKKNEAHPILRGITGNVRAALNLFAEYGLNIDEMRLSGGQAKNPRWNAYKAAACGCSLLVPEIQDAELTGGAACAAYALGHASTISEACSNLVVISQRY